MNGVFNIPDEAEVTVVRDNAAPLDDLDFDFDFFDSLQIPLENPEPAMVEPVQEDLANSCPNLLLEGNHQSCSTSILICMIKNTDPILQNISKVLESKGYKIHVYSKTGPLEILNIKKENNWPIMVIELVSANLGSCLRSDVGINVNSYAGAQGVLETIQKIEKDYLDWKSK